MGLAGESSSTSSSTTCFVQIFSRSRFRSFGNVLCNRFVLRGLSAVIGSPGSVVRVEQRIETKPRMRFTNHQRARGKSHCLCFCFGFFVAVVFSSVPSHNKWLAANRVGLSPYYVSPGCANEYNQLEGFLAFLNMSARYNFLLKKFDKVPAFSSLDMYVWETHPKTIYMPSNSHMTWYTDNANERKLIT